MSAAAIAGIVTRETPLIRVRCEAVGAGRDCRILDLKPSGAFIESFVPLATGSQVNLRFCLPNGHPVHVSGLVNYHQFKVGFGVEFTDLSRGDLDQICNFMG
jgi:hypothetical protein